MAAAISMPPRTANLATTWAFIEEGVSHIMTKGQTGLSYLRYMSLYTAVFNYCTSTKIHGAPERTGVGSRTGANLMPFDLYDKLTRFFVAYLNGIRDKTCALEDEALLRYYAEEWDRYTIGAYYVNRLLTYLNRYCEVKPKKGEGRKGVYPVYTLALVKWRDNIFIPLQQEQTKLTSAILRLIEAQRNGDAIDQGLVKKVVGSFVSLGLDDTDINKTCLDIYTEHFELPFINATEKYYQEESKSILAVSSLSNYLKKAEERLQEEEDRVERCLNTQTRKTLISKCDDVLIRQYSGMMGASFQSLRDEDLQRLYSLLSRIPEGLGLLRKNFEEHVTKAGLAAVSKCVGGSGANIDALDPKAYVDALLEVYSKNSEMIIRGFRGEAAFVASLDRACQEFMNKNAATGASNSKSPELIAKYTDLILRSNNKLAKDELEGALNRVMILFKYIKDKDVFQTFYTTKLSDRLIRGVSASDKSEASMILKLKEACGFVYTNKLQRMFTDVSLSKDLTDQFKSRMEQNHENLDIGFSVMVLGTNFWLLHPLLHEFLIPTEVLPTYDRFQKFYQMEHSGRKLTWLWNYSKNELHTNYLNRKYILKTSTFQMAILLQYNENDTLSLSELSAATSIPTDYLAQVLAILVKTKVLIKKETDKYDLNLGFKSKNIRVNLNLPIKAETKRESTDVLKSVDKERKYVIQAAIVRIMKARKTMESQPLIQEVISQVSEKFAPKIPDIKKAIDSLVVSENIERVNGTRDTFAYIA